MAQGRPCPVIREKARVIMHPSHLTAPWLRRAAIATYTLRQPRKPRTGQDGRSSAPGSVLVHHPGGPACKDASPRGDLHGHSRL